jgi:hypothetical protein
MGPSSAGAVPFNQVAMERAQRSLVQHGPTPQLSMLQMFDDRAQALATASQHGSKYSGAGEEEDEEAAVAALLHARRNDGQDRRRKVGRKAYSTGEEPEEEDGAWSQGDDDSYENGASKARKRRRLRYKPSGEPVAEEGEEHEDVDGKASTRGRVGGALRLHKRVAFGGHGTSRQWQGGMSKYLGVVQGTGENSNYWYVTAQKGTGRRYSSRFESLDRAEAYLLEKFRVLGINPAAKIRPGYPGDDFIAASEAMAGAARSYVAPYPVPHAVVDAFGAAPSSSGNGGGSSPPGPSPRRGEEEKERSNYPPPPPAGTPGVVDHASN